MIAIDSLADMRDKYLAAVRNAVRCNSATIDTRGRPRSCVMHPIWGGSTGWILSGRSSLKAMHLQRRPHVSLAYIADPIHPVNVDAKAEWIEDAAKKARNREMFSNTGRPVGYDPARFFGSVESEWTGLLKITSRRIDLHGTISPSNLIWTA